MNEVFRAALELQKACEVEKWQYCFIGGLALLRWGEPRETIDADLTLMTGFGNELPYVQTLLRYFEGRIRDAESFALENRVLLLRSQSGIGLDVSLGALPYETDMISRSSSYAYSPDVNLRTCSAEDLIVLKSFAARGQDWVDVERLIVRQSGKLDWSYINGQLGPLLEMKGEPDLMKQLDERRARLEKKC